MYNIIYIISLVTLISIISCTYDFSYILDIKLKKLYNLELNKNLEFKRTLSNFYYYNINPDSISSYYIHFTFFLIIILLPFLCLINIKYKIYLNQNNINIFLNVLFCIVILKIYFSYMIDTIIKVPHIRELHKY